MLCRSLIILWIPHRSTLLNFSMMTPKLPYELLFQHPQIIIRNRSAAALAAALPEIATDDSVKFSQGIFHNLARTLLFTSLTINIGPVGCG